tara:strand:+ start:6325 stop:6600 length:276 start_codon:yes stop_codon:yes gene_type:complete
MQNANEFIEKVFPKILKSGGIWDQKTMQKYSNKVNIKEVNLVIKNILGTKVVPENIGFILAHFGFCVDGGIAYLFKTQTGLNILKRIGVLN